MSYRPSYQPGNWKVICDVCGRQYKSYELQMRWDGVMVCSGDWEPRQPQDFVRGIPDTMRTPWSRVEPEDQFIPVEFIIYPGNADS